MHSRLRNDVTGRLTYLQRSKQSGGREVEASQEHREEKKTWEGGAFSMQT